ncbi:SH3 domain-containing protein [Noviherbaspirillum sp. ST9]|uniref:SH3 domain-containing protein n=1 Tax=Noviherbaspirillum sp. ST9 TaxID=3401606 RepID=UPI003B589F68
MKKWLLMLAGLLAGAAWAESALTTRSTELQAQPQSDSAVITTLSENTKVEVLARKGAWSQVKTATGQTGWVRMLSLKPEASGQSAPASSNPAGALGNLLTAGRTSNTGTVTTGVRGLSEEDLQNAQANPAEVEKMQKFSVDKNAAQSFAQRGKLTPVKVEYLPDAAPAGNNQRNAEGG